MINYIFRILNYLRSLWYKLPPTVRKNIINIIVHAFESIFREYYKYYKEKGKK